MSVSDENKLEIDLAYDTMVWLNTLDDSEIPEDISVRDIVSNLLDFQDRFANPLDVPFLVSKPEEPKYLETPRYLPALIRFRCAYQLPDSYVNVTIDPLDGLIEDGKAYCLAGSQLWYEALDKNEITLPEEDMQEPILSRYEWLYDLFILFREIEDPVKRASAREIAARWYLVAMQIGLDPEDETEEDQINTITNMLSSLSLDHLENGDNIADSITIPEKTLLQASPELGTPASMMGALMGEASPDEDSHEPKSLLAQLLLSENFDEEDDEDDEDYVPPEEEEEEEDDYYISSEEVEETLENLKQMLHKSETEEEKEENEIEKEFRELVLETIDKLGSYLPTDEQWLKRFTNTSIYREKKKWFPWGFPPMDKIKNSLNSKDESESHFNSKLLQYFDK